MGKIEAVVLCAMAKKTFVSSSANKSHFICESTATLANKPPSSCWVATDVDETPLRANLWKLDSNGNVLLRDLTPSFSTYRIESFAIASDGSQYVLVSAGVNAFDLYLWSRPAGGVWADGWSRFIGNFTSARPFCGLAIDGDDNILVGYPTQTLKLDPNNNMLWSSNFLGANSGSASAIAVDKGDNNKVYVGCDGRLGALNNSDGSVVWQRIWKDPLGFRHAGVRRLHCKHGLIYGANPF